MRFKAFLTRFERITSNKNFIPEIDGLRFISIILIMIYHWNTAYVREMGMSINEWRNLYGYLEIDNFSWWLVRFDMGVKIFFALSGFILGIPFIKAYIFDQGKFSVKEYFIRRITRLEVPYILTLIFFSLVHLIIFKENFKFVLLHFFAGLFYVHGFIFGGWNFINPVTWSLETEAQFYVLVPLLFFSLRKLKLKTTLILLISLILFSICYRYLAIVNDWSHFKTSIFALFSNFGVGLIFAFIYILRREFFKYKSYIYDLLAIVSILLMFYYYNPQHILINSIFFNSGILLFFLCSFKSKLFNAFLNIKVIYLIGGMCYSIYLLHYAFYHLWVKFSIILTFDNWSYWPNFWFQFFGAFIVTIFISSLFYLFVEKPCMKRDWHLYYFEYFKKMFKRD